MGGFLFGPVWGIVIVAIGGNLSAMVAYTVGRYFGQGILDNEESSGVMQRYADKMRTNSFETILVMRFIFLPYDLVNYMGGLLRVDWKAFLVATTLGSIPGTIAFVLAGASLDWECGRRVAHRQAVGAGHVGHRVHHQHRPVPRLQATPARRRCADTRCRNPTPGIRNRIDPVPEELDCNTLARTLSGSQTDTRLHAP